MKKTLASVIGLTTFTLFLGTAFGQEQQLFITSIEARASHSLALTNDGTVLGFGNNLDGSLGDIITCRLPPVYIKGLTNIKAISAGEDHSLALAEDGTVWAWGTNDSGQLGDGTTENHYTPVHVKGLTNIKAIVAGGRLGGSYSLALANDGTVWAWGGDCSGTLGDGIDDRQQLTPVQIKGLADIKAIAAGATFSIALANDGTVWGWGDFSGGQLGDITLEDTLDKWPIPPVQIKGLADIKAIAAGDSFSIALTNDGTVWAWGYNGDGQLGDGTTEERDTPIRVKDLTNIKAISAGEYHSLALAEDGTVWAWGDNFVKNQPPVHIEGPTNIKDIAAGTFHSLALANDGTVWAWGANSSDQLGIDEEILDGQNTPAYIGIISPQN